MLHDPHTAQMQPAAAADLSTIHVSQEIQDLQSVAVPEHISSNRVAQAARAARYPVTLSTYSFQLLMAFLQGSKLWLLLGIVNQYIKVQVPFTPNCSTLSQTERTDWSVCCSCSASTT